MDDLQSEKLKRLCVIICEGLCEASEATKKAVSALAETLAAIDLEIICLYEEFPKDPVEDFARAIKEKGGTIDSEWLHEMAELAEDMPLIIRKKIPRAPKYIGPVNKTNYTANRPTRMARSSCRIIRHR